MVYGYTAISLTGGRVKLVRPLDKETLLSVPHSLSYLTRAENEDTLVETLSFLRLRINTLNVAQKSLWLSLVRLDHFKSQDSSGMNSDSGIHKGSETCCYLFPGLNVMNGANHQAVVHSDTSLGGGGRVILINSNPPT